jgi:hypothetical protein
VPAAVELAGVDNGNTGLSMREASCWNHLSHGQDGICWPPEEVLPLSGADLMTEVRSDCTPGCAPEGMPKFMRNGVRTGGDGNLLIESPLFATLPRSA